MTNDTPTRLSGPHSWRIGLAIVRLAPCRWLWAGALVLALANPCFGQIPVSNPSADQARPWRPSFGSPGNSDQLVVPPAQTQPGVTRVARTMDQLPRSAGQIWREYDITPYTSKVTTANPEQAVLNWILRETGKELWFRGPMSILHVDRERVYVYHTPAVHQQVKPIIDRFVRTRGQVQALDVNLVTITQPNWRSQAYTMLQPIDVNSAGVEAWLISKENAAILLAQLRRRADFRQHSGGRLTHHDGQPLKLNKTQPVQFVRSLRWLPNQAPGYQPLQTTINEGYLLELSCLTSLDNQSIEATIECQVEQLEKLNPVRVDIPLASGSHAVNLQIPQLVSWRLHERIRWPSDQVLLLSCGVVASPDPVDQRRSPIPFLKPPGTRADALLFIDYRGPATGATIGQAPLQSTAQRPLGPIVR